MADFVTERYRKVALSIFEIIMFLCLIITFLGSQYSNADQDKFTVDIPQPEKNVFSTDEIVRINFLVKNHLNATRNAVLRLQFIHYWIILEIYYILKIILFHHIRNIG